MRKYDFISALAKETAAEVVKNREEWMKYLTTAARLYKYPFREQLLIYAQRPDATACASIELWNERMHCWVNKGAKGDDAIGMDDEAAEPEKPQETVKTVDNKRDEVADMPAKQSNLGKTAMGGKLSDRPAERTSLQEKLAAMKARVSGTPAGRDAADKTKKKEEIL